VGLPSGLLPSDVPPSNPVGTSPLHNMCYMPCQSQYSRFNHPNDIWWRVKAYKFSVCKYKVVLIWPGRFVCKQVTLCPGHIWTTLYLTKLQSNLQVTRVKQLSQFKPDTKFCKFWAFFLYVSKQTIFDRILSTPAAVLLLNNTQIMGAEIPCKMLPGWWILDGGAQYLCALSIELAS
jgi:hypothetical protein